jgi:hypothetical protein
MSQLVFGGHRNPEEVALTPSKEWLDGGTHGLGSECEGKQAKGKIFLLHPSMHCHQKVRPRFQAGLRPQMIQQVCPAAWVLLNPDVINYPRLEIPARWCSPQYPFSEHAGMLLSSELRRSWVYTAWLYLGFSIWSLQLLLYWCVQSNCVGLESR